MLSSGFRAVYLLTGGGFWLKMNKVMQIDLIRK